MAVVTGGVHQFAPTRRTGSILSSNTHDIEIQTTLDRRQLPHEMMVDLLTLHRSFVDIKTVSATEIADTLLYPCRKDLSWRFAVI